ncbi:MAG: LytTR family transcriptional regulator DNA-binding domain-containing protein [Cyclobacteriaceae bacterium]
MNEPTPKNINILIVEDEPLYSKVLEMELEDLGYHVVGIATNAEDAFVLLKEKAIDIVLLDIVIEGDKDGIDIGNHIRSTYDIPFIFTSSMTSEEVIDRAKVTKPAGYLVKPFDTKDLIISIQVALYKSDTDKPAKQVSGHFFKEDRIFVKDKFRFERVFFSDILYLEADGNYVRLSLENKDYLLASTLSNLYEKITSDDLIRTHRSFVVNVEKIDAIEGNRLFIGETEIPVGRNYKEEVHKYFNFL